jgi:hypothetical protein
MISIVSRSIGLFILAGAILAPAATIAAPGPQEAGVSVRVYDSNHRDYHNWDDREDRAYRRYYSEQHKTYREYNKQNARDQRNYWKWRHNHPD